MVFKVSKFSPHKILANRTYVQCLLADVDACRFDRETNFASLSEFVYYIPTSAQMLTLYPAIYLHIKISKLDLKVNKILQ